MLSVTIISAWLILLTRFYTTVLVAIDSIAAGAQIDPSHSSGGANMHPPSNRPTSSTQLT